jgi:predicted enzyme related to lactoylglutathione lyase
MTHGVIHWEIGTRDASGLQKFYSDLFDWKITPAGPEYALVAAEDEGIGGGIMQVTDGMPPYLTFYVEVDDLESALARSNELGANAIVPPTSIPGVGRFAMFQDPDEHVVGLLEPSGDIEP